MIRIAGKNLIEHNIERLPDEIDEIILVVNYLAEQIINHFGNEFAGRKVKYVKQTKLLGTGHAIHSCRSLLDDKFLVLMGDDIYSAEDVKKCLEHDMCLLTKEIRGKFTGGRIKLSSSGHLEDIVEGVHKKKNSLLNIGLYVLSKRFFDYDLVQIPGRKEYGLPQTIVKVAEDYPVCIERAVSWLQISDIAGLKRAERVLNQGK